MCGKCNVNDKFCYHCKKTKSIKEFRKINNKVLDWCEECCKEYENRLYIEKEQLPEIPPNHKFCCTCKNIKMLNEFEYDKSSKDKLKRNCISCCREVVRVHQQKVQRILKEKFPKEVIPSGFKKCYECEEIKSHSEFGTESREPDHLNIRCKECNTKARRKNRKKQSMKIIADDMRKCPDCREIKPKKIYKTTEYGRVCPDCNKNRERVVKEEIAKEQGKIYAPEGYKQCSECGDIVKKDDMRGHVCKNCLKIMGKLRIEILILRPKIFEHIRTCKRCDIEKPIEEYIKSKNSKTGFTYICKECFNKNVKLKGRNRSKETEQHKERMKTDTRYRIKCTVSSAVRTALKNIGKKKEKSTAAYGIDFDAIYKHIGERPSKNYHLDHIIPLRAFDFNIPEHIRLSHIPENLRWIPRKENLSKQDLILWPIISSSPELLSIANILHLSEHHDNMNAADIFNYL